MRRVAIAAAAAAVVIWCLPVVAADVTLRFGRIVKMKDKDGTANDQVIVKFVKESGLTDTLPSPSRSVSSRARAIGTAALSIPTNVEPGSAAAIGSRLPPTPQPSSSTRQRAGGVGDSPNSVASVASRSGWVCTNGRGGYSRTS